MSRKVELFLAAKKTLRVHPEWEDQQIADQLGARLIECQEVLTAARKDVAADTMELP